MKNVLVLAAHPDDETLGCGGTLLRHKANGDRIHWLIATGMSKEEGFASADISRRDKEIEKVRGLYAFDGVSKLDIPTTKVDDVPINELVEKISKVFREVEPEILYLPFRGDVHSDHRMLFDAAYSCTKTFRYPFIKKILMMEIISETEFVPGFKDAVFIPNYFVNIGSFLEKKIEIMKTFESELGEQPFPRSLENIRALATFRGAMSGCDHAESFMILKEIS